jgi:hypothetical protein
MKNHLFICRMDRLWSARASYPHSGETNYSAENEKKRHFAKKNVS